MKLAKKTEMTPLESLRREMDRFFDDITPFRWKMENGGEAVEMWAPNSDMVETDKEYIVTMDLPGMSKKEIDISYKDNRMTIKGDRHQKTEEEKKDFIRKERYEGKFVRSFTLPGEIMEEKIHASFKDGVLTVEIPKAETSKARSIEIDG